MKDYKILIVTSAPAMESAVKEKLAEGWQLLGGIVVTTTKNPNNGQPVTMFLQSIVK